MSKVNTVLGPVDSSALGRTRMHEHLIIKYPGTDQDPLVEFDKEGTAKAVTEQLLALKAKGVSTVVDATPITLGRYVEFMATVAEASGMNIIAATGFYTRRQDKQARLRPEVDILQREATHGDQGFGDMWHAGKGGDKYRDPTSSDT